jgi:hypothetical protein
VAEIVGQDERFETSCTNCGVKIRFQKKDVRAGERLPHSHDDHKTVITCPNKSCHHIIDVTRSYGISSVETYNKQLRDEDYY